MAAGNIKKDVSIFGVTGSYYETKRYIIQNGQNTGLCTLSTLSGSDTKSWGGSTWKLLSKRNWWYVDSDEGTVTTEFWYINITNYSSIVTINRRSNSGGGNIPWSASCNFKVGGDILIYTYTGYEGKSTDVGCRFMVGMTTGTSKQLSNFVYFQTGTVSCANNTYAPATISSTISSSSWTKESWYWLIKEGWFCITHTGVPREKGHDDYGTQIWCKNLWFDTSGSMTYNW